MRVVTFVSVNHVHDVWSDCTQLTTACISPLHRCSVFDNALSSLNHWGQNDAYMHPSKGPSLLHIMAWRLFGADQYCEPQMGCWQNGLFGYLGEIWKKWRHQRERLLALCGGNSPVTGEFPSQRPVTWSFDIFSLICARIYGWINNREAGDVRRHRPHYAHYDIIVIK